MTLHRGGGLLLSDVPRTPLIFPLRNAVFKMMKSENSLVMMEEARKKKKVVREKTEFEIVKERE